MAQYSSDKPIEVFISYSHKDKRMRDELVEHLANLKNQEVITTWHDRKISAGNEWAGEIDQHLNTASVILLLISSHFMASDYCNDVEVKCAMKRDEEGDAKVIPVILRPVDWANAPFSKLQALPTDAKPVLQWSHRDEAYLDIVKGIRNAIEDLGKPSTPDAPIHVTKRSSIPPDSGTTSRSHKWVVMMDSTLPKLVFDPATRAKGGTNADDITPILIDLPVQTVKETTSLQWSREEQLLQLNPDLVIVHLSAFDDKSNAKDSDHKFRTFLKYMAGSKTKFLIYSRVIPKLANRQHEIHILTQNGFLVNGISVDRLHLFHVPGRGQATFRDPQTAREFKLRVKSLLGVP